MTHVKLRGEDCVPPQAGPGNGRECSALELARKAGQLDRGALLASIRHALQFADEPETAVRSLIHQINVEYDDTQKVSG